MIIAAIRAISVSDLRSVVELAQGDGVAPAPGEDRASCSVIMTCYNEGAYIEAAVRSVLAQTVQCVIDKIVIADDGSDQATRDILSEIAHWDDRIDILYGEGGLGLPSNRNRAANRCRAPYLAILDGDDIWEATKLEKQLALMRADGSIGLVYTGFSTFSDGDISTARPARILDITGASDLSLTYFLNDPPIIPSTILVRKTAFDAIGGFDPSIPVFEDTDFYLRISRHCGFGLVDEPLLLKRNRKTSITGGRPDLMMHHARVAFKFATTEPRMMPRVPRRLAERARKLGNQKFLMGDQAGAIAHLRLATKLDIWNFRAWFSWVVASFL